MGALNLANFFESLTRCFSCLEFWRRSVLEPRKKDEEKSKNSSAENWIMPPEHELDRAEVCFDKTPCWKSKKPISLSKERGARQRQFGWPRWTSQVAFSSFAMQAIPSRYYCFCTPIISSFLYRKMMNIRQRVFLFFCVDSLQSSTSTIYCWTLLNTEEEWGNFKPKKGSNFFLFLCFSTPE